MKNFQLLLLITILASCSTKSEKQEGMKKPSDFFPKEKTQVLVVGTFHFHYPGLDAHQIDDKDKINVLEEPKKSEVTELVEYIKKFKPTKIAIEAKPSWNATEKLKKYKQGEFREERDERYQLGMRIANDLGIDTLYAIDAKTMAEDIMQRDSVYTNNLWADFDFESDDPYEAHIQKWRESNDKLILETNLLDYFKYLNSKEYHQYDYGTYLVGDFKLDNERGADILSYWWYNRNARIFRKLQTITESPQDRILVIFGNGHVSVLRQLIESSPEFEFVEFTSLTQE